MTKATFMTRTQFSLLFQSLFAEIVANLKVLLTDLLKTCVTKKKVTFPAIHASDSMIRRPKVKTLDINSFSTLMASIEHNKNVLNKKETCVILGHLLNQGI